MLHLLHQQAEQGHAAQAARLPPTAQLAQLAEQLGVEARVKEECLEVQRDPLAVIGRRPVQQLQPRAAPAAAARRCRVPRP